MFALVLFPLLLAGTAHGALLTVGPTGTYATLQAAVDAALLAGGTNEIRLMQGTYLENISITMTAGKLTILGGWNNTFTRRSADPNLTVLDGGSAGAVVSVHHSGGALSLEGVKVLNGAVSGVSVYGAGLYVDVHGGTFSLRDSKVTGNTVLGTSSTGGAGMRAGVFAPGSMDIVNSVFQNNAVNASAYEVAGGAGLAVAATGTVTILGNDIGGNSISGDLHTRYSGGGMSLAFLGGSARVEGNVVSDNVLTGPGSEMQIGAAYVVATSGANVVMRRNLYGATTNSVGAGVAPVLAHAELAASANTGASLLFSDSIAGVGSGDGVKLTTGETDGTGTVHLTNLRILNNAGTGLVVNQTGTASVSVYNSIVTNNGPAGGDNLLYSGTVDSWYNYVSASPPTGADRVDQGTNAPPGGLGDWDLYGRSRIYDAIVDIGESEQPLHCTNVVQDADETGLDCGGSVCLPCFLALVGDTVDVTGAGRYGAIQDGYDAAGDGATIHALERFFREHIILDRPVAVSLLGGFNTFGGTNAGRYSTVEGTLTLGGGTVRVENIVVK